MNPVSETILCDLCGEDDTKLLFSNADWQQPALEAFKLVRCLNCGLIYLNPRPSPDAIATYYPPDYVPFRPAIEDEPFTIMRWMRRRKLSRRRDLIEKFSGKQFGQLLDVGCATGLFLHEMALAKWEVSGVELSESAAEYARSRFGLNVFQGMLPDAPYAPASFDVVTFWDVLEHTFSPTAILTQTAELLRPGGLVAINIPNWESSDRRWFGAQWIGLDPPRHLYVFPQQVLNEMLQRTGFEVLDWVCFIPAYFSFAISIEQKLNFKALNWAPIVSKILNFPGMRFLFEPYFLFANWRKRSGVISVFARKK